MTATHPSAAVIPFAGREHRRAKAARLLIEGRLTVLSAHQGRVRATVRGDSATYRLGFDRGRWWCHCPARGRCSHLVALASVIDTSAWEGDDE
jgi:uncharacterized Zn finger protein